MSSCNQAAAVSEATQIETGGLLEPLEPGVDHVRGPDAATAVIVEYGDYECPYSRLAFREIERVERALQGQVRLAYRHYPLVQSIRTRSTLPPPRRQRRSRVASLIEAIISPQADDRM
jgi:protein-disulfide isomerase